jgi:AcrR family transcriptional regulator
MLDELPLLRLAAVPPAERSDAAANRERVLVAARRLFAERGVTAVTMEEIAQAAGVGKGTLYRRYAGKGELCLALLNDHLIADQDRTLAELRAQRATGRPFLASIAWFLAALVDFHDEHLDLLYEAHREGQPRLGERVSALAWQQLTVRLLLQAAVAAGEVAPIIDPAYLADALLAPLSGPLFRFHRTTRGYTTGQIKTGLRTLVSGLAVKDARR